MDRVHENTGQDPPDYDELARILGSSEYIPFNTNNADDPLMSLSWLSEYQTMQRASSTSSPAPSPLPTHPYFFPESASEGEDKEDAAELELKCPKPLQPLANILQPIPHQGKMDNMEEIEKFIRQTLTTPQNAEIEFALEANRRSQELLKQVLEKIEEDLEINSVNAQYLNELIQTEKQMASASAQDDIPDPFGFVLGALAKNKIVVSEMFVQKYKQYQRRHLQMQKDPRWTLKQKKGLARGVRQQTQKRLMDTVMEAHREAALSSLQLELDQIRQMPERELESMSSGIDYDRISRMFVPKKTCVDCRIQWENVDCPLINRAGKWELGELLCLRSWGDQVLQGDTITWREVAAEVGNNRSAFACAVEYQQRYCPHQSRGKWSKEEDEQLRVAVDRLGEDDWPMVAALVPGRSSHQCLHRWNKTLRPNIKRGKWTAHEDQLLVDAVNALGIGVWHRIAACVPLRTDVQCRERWTNILDPSIKHGPFSDDELEVLKTAVGELGEGKWAAVAARLPGRTDNQCWRRWKRMD